MGSGMIGRIFLSDHLSCHSRGILPKSSYHATTHATSELSSQSLPIMPLPMPLQNYPPKVFLSCHYPCHSRVILPKSSYHITTHATTHATPELSSQNHPILPLPMPLQRCPPKIFLSCHYPCHSGGILPKSSYHATTHATPEVSSQNLPTMPLPMPLHRSPPKIYLLCHSTHVTPEVAWVVA
jgi:hypothetical protein